VYTVPKKFSCFIKGGISLLHLGLINASFYQILIIRQITESQNHRMLGVGRDTQRPSSPTPLPKQVHIEQVAWDLIQVGFENLQRMRLRSAAPLGSLFQCFITLRGKKFFVMFRSNFLCFSLRPLPLVLSLGTTEKSLAPSS